MLTLNPHGDDFEERKNVFPFRKQVSFFQISARHLTNVTGRHEGKTKFRLILNGRIIFLKTRS
jgi:hypothetical protein